MKRIVLFLALILVATVAYAPCYYPRSHHTDYWQYHRSCDPDCHAWQAYTDWWSLDGTCDTLCDEVTTICDGDTHIDSRTILEFSSGPCDPICE